MDLVLFPEMDLVYPVIPLNTDNSAVMELHVQATKRVYKLLI